MTASMTADTLALPDIGPRLRAMRRAKGMSQEELAQLLNCSQSYLAKLEAGRPMTPAMRRAAESMLRVAAEDGHVNFLLPFVALEGVATRIRTYDVLVPGPLQVREYARSVLAAANPGIPAADLDRQTEARMARQAIWDRTDPMPPLFSAIIDESAIRRKVGSAQVMRSQLARLAELASPDKHPGLTIQVLPFDADGPVGVVTSFVILSFSPEDRPDTGYTEDTISGRTFEKPHQVGRLGLLFDAMAPRALRPRESADLIAEAAEQWT